MSSPGLTDPRDPSYAFNACSLRAGTTSIRARWKRPIFRRRFAKVHASVRTQSPKQYSVSNIVSYIYTYHKSKCIIISSHVLSCFVIYCLILSYTISCISSMDWFNIKMIGSHGCLPILGGFSCRFPSAKLWDCVQSSWEAQPLVNHQEIIHLSASPNASWTINGHETNFSKANGT